MVYLRYNLADGQSHTINIRLVAYLAGSRSRSSETVGPGQSPSFRSSQPQSAIKIVIRALRSFPREKKDQAGYFGAKIWYLREVPVLQP